MKSTDYVFTVAEVQMLLRELDPGSRTLSDQMIRFWDRPGGVQPSRVVERTRLYTVIDVALLRLVEWLQEQKHRQTQARLCSRFAIRAALQYRGRQIRTALESRSRRIVTFENQLIKVRFPPPHNTAPLKVPFLFYTDQLLEGLDEAASALREERPKVWVGHWRPVAEVTRHARGKRESVA